MNHTKRITGIYETISLVGENVKSFIPYPLPPEKPPLDVDNPSGALHRAVAAADAALQRLNFAALMIPDLSWFIYAFVRKEAVLTSQIEGTQATLVDLFAFEATKTEKELDKDINNIDKDIDEVCNYLDAVMFAVDQLNREDGLPISMRLLNETHRLLMRGVRGADKQPGEVRRSQNWIGGSKPSLAVHIPPSPHRLPEVLAQFERYIHDDMYYPSTQQENAQHDGVQRAGSLHPLVRIGLLHVQFETIHPYLDGNGRIGRLLITLLLRHYKLLHEPLLYLSLFFKKHHALYYQKLNAVRTDGDWEGWLLFFLDGIVTVADESAKTAQQLFALVAKQRRELLNRSGVAVSTLRLFEALPQHPIITAGSVTKMLQVSKPTADKAIQELIDAQILQKMSDNLRNRKYVYQQYIHILGA